MQTEEEEHPLEDLDTRRIRAPDSHSLFREVNERIAVLSRKYAQEFASNGYVCECLNINCAESVQLAHDDYVRLRRDDDCFFVLPGHEDPAAEAIVRATDSYLVVKRFGVDLAKEPA